MDTQKPFRILYRGGLFAPSLDQTFVPSRPLPYEDRGIMAAVAWTLLSGGRDIEQVQELLRRMTGHTYSVVIDFESDEGRAVWRETASTLTITVTWIESDMSRTSVGYVHGAEVLYG